MRTYIDNLQYFPLNPMPSNQLYSSSMYKCLTVSQLQLGRFTSLLYFQRNHQYLRWIQCSHIILTSPTCLVVLWTRCFAHFGDTPWHSFHNIRIIRLQSWSALCVHSVSFNVLLSFVYLATFTSIHIIIMIIYGWCDILPHLWRDQTLEHIQLAQVSTYFVWFK